MSYLEKIKAQLRELGAVDAALYAASRAMSNLSAGRLRLVKYYFVKQPVPAAPAVPMRAGSFIFVRPETADWPGFIGAGRPRDVLAERYAQGAKCVAALNKDGQLAGFLWYTRGNYEEDEVRARFVPLPAGQAAWDFDVMVVPRYRLGRLFGQLWQQAGADLREQGVAYTISRIWSFNAASMASHRRLGARTVGRSLFLCIGRWQWMYAPAAPSLRTDHGSRWHFSRSAQDRPTLRVGGLND